MIPPPIYPTPKQVPGRNTASKSGRGLARLDRLLAGIHGKLMKGERGDHIRKAMGAGPVAKQNVRKFDRLGKGGGVRRGWVEKGGGRGGGRGGHGIREEGGGREGEGEEGGGWEGRGGRRGEGVVPLLALL